MSLAVPGPAYRVRTPRLVLRCWDPRDAVLLAQAIEESAAHLRPWMPWAHGELPGLQDRIERLRQWRAKFDLDEDFYYGLFDLEETQVLGAAGLHTRLGAGVREIGYWIHKDCIDRGLGTEAAAGLIRVAFEVDCVQRVEIQCDPANVRSAAIPEKLGFTCEAILRKRKPFLAGKLRDTMIWTLFAEEYPGSPASMLPVEAFDAIGRQIL